MTASLNRAARGMRESDLDDQVHVIARTLGIRRYHTYDSRRSEPGFPDLVLVGRAGVLYRELKRQTGRTTPAQDEWLAALQGAGQDAAVWRPADLLNGQIARQLTAIAALTTTRSTR